MSLFFEGANVQKLSETGIVIPKGFFAELLNFPFN
jgi:hypothetical protein